MNSTDLKDEYALPPGMPALVRRAPKKGRFIMVPSVWADRLEGAPGRTYGLALHLLYVAWRQKSGEFTLANKALSAAGISRYSKWRALGDLERRGLIEVERHQRKSPTIRMQNMPHG